MGEHVPASTAPKWTPTNTLAGGLRLTSVTEYSPEREISKALNAEPPTGTVAVKVSITFFDGSVSPPPQPIATTPASATALVFRKRMEPFWQVWRVIVPQDGSRVPVLACRDDVARTWHWSEKTLPASHESVRRG